jgi:hypothetical protein
MMSFASDLFDTLLEEEPAEEDLAGLVAKAVARGDVSPLARALDSNRVNAKTPDAVIKQILMMSEDLIRGRSDVFDGWVRAACAGRPDRMIDLALASMGFCEDRRDLAAARILALGVDPHRLGGQRIRDIAGMRPQMQTRQETTYGRALYTNAPFALEIAQKNPQDVPIVAELRVGETGAFCRMNAIAFSIACGHPSPTEALLDLHGWSNPTPVIRKSMGESIHQMIESGLADTGPDEVAHSIISMLASGADLIGRGASIAQHVLRVEPYVTAEFANNAAHSVLFPAMLASHPDEIEASTVLRRLYDECLWVPDSNINLDAPGRKLVHYAAIAGRQSLIDTLHDLGADLFALDKNGRSALDYAKAFGHEDIAEFLSFLKDYGGVLNSSAEPDAPAKPTEESMFDSMMAAQRARRSVPGQTQRPAASTDAKEEKEDLSATRRKPRL